MKHLTDEELGAYVDGALKGRDAEAAGRHLADCQPCREALAELAAQDESLKSVLTHDPGEAYFERFAARVEERIGAAAALRARPRGGPYLGRLFRSPRALAWAGGVAVLVVGGGLALLTSRDATVPGLRDREASRLEQAAPGEAKQAPSVEVPQAPPAAPPISVDEARERARPPGAEQVQDASGAGAPAPASERERVAARDQRRVPADGFAPAPSPAPSAAIAPAGPRPASPSRAMEVRRNEAGEEVPVRPPTGNRIDAPPAPAAARREDPVGRVQKRQFAQPLEAAKKPAPRSSLDATEDKARAYSFSQPPGETRFCGDVRDAEARPVAGAQVVLTDLGRSTTTDAAGRFCIEAPAGEHALSVMAVGFAESRQRVRTEDAEPGLKVTLAAVPVLEEKGMLVSRRAAPGRGSIGTASESRSPPADEPHDAYSVLSDTVRRVVREAQRIEADAAARRSATHYDMAARAWERALRRLADGPLEIETRRHLADARYHAWELAPNSRRALAAVEALTAYAGRAPAGPGRDEAARRLQRVRP